MRVALLLAGLGVWATLAAGGAAADDGPRTVFRFDDQVTESSGLVDLGSRVLTVNDSGDDAVVYVIDPATGATVGRTTYADEATDVEAITTGPDGAVWVGDIGDNGGTRTGVQVHRIERPVDGDRRVEATTYQLVYRGGARDAETLLVSPQGRLHVVSKGLFGGQVWRAPATLRRDRPNVLTPVEDVGGMVTDGAWFRDGRHVVLRDYTDASVYEVTGDSWRFVGRLRLPDQEQGEGISVRRNGRLLISSEGRSKAVVEVPLTPRLRHALAPPGSGGSRQAPPDVDDPYGEREPGSGLGNLVRDRDSIRTTVVAGTSLIVLMVLVHRFVRISPRRRR